MKKPSIELVFLALISIFVLLLAYFFIPFSDSLKRLLFPIVAFLGALFLVIGVRLAIQARKEKGKLRFFLIVTGLSTIFPLVGTLLHNLFYALAIKFTTFAPIFEFLHGAFFILALIVAPILFLVGIIGSIILLPQKKGRKKWTIAILLIILIIIPLSNLFITHETYSSDEFKVKYPEDYSVSDSTNKDRLVIIEGDDNKGMVKIYNTNELDTELIHGYSSSGLEEFESKLVPKEKITKENYEIWLFYTENDDETKSELQDIADSITIK
jgi:uncharacterized membrane protein